MKKLIVLSLLAIFSQVMTAQPIGTGKLYTAYRGSDGVISLYIPGFLCRFAAAIGDLEPDEEKLLRAIKSIRILSVEDSRLNEKINFVEEINTARIGKEYEKLLEVHDKNEHVLIYAKHKNDLIRELTIIVGGDDNALVCIKGRLDHDLLYALTEVTGITECNYTKEL